MNNDKGTVEVKVKLQGIDEVNEKLEHTKELLETIKKLYQEVQSNFNSINCIDVELDA